jgi:hypothetical protein
MFLCVSSGLTYSIACCTVCWKLNTGDHSYITHQKDNSNSHLMEERCVCVGGGWGLGGSRERREVQYVTLTLTSTATDGDSESDIAYWKLRTYHSTAIIILFCGHVAQSMKSTGMCLKTSTNFRQPIWQNCNGFMQYITIHKFHKLSRYNRILPLCVNSNLITDANRLHKCDSGYRLLNNE